MVVDTPLSTVEWHWKGFKSTWYWTMLTDCWKAPHSGVAFQSTSVHNQHIFRSLQASKWNHSTPFNYDQWTTMLRQRTSDGDGFLRQLELIQFFGTQFPPEACIDTCLQRHRDKVRSCVHRGGWLPHWRCCVSVPQCCYLRLANHYCTKACQKSRAGIARGMSSSLCVSAVWQFLSTFCVLG